MGIKKSNVTTKSEINYEIIEECGTVADRKGGYALKLRYMQWNGRDPVYDLRPWKQTDTGEEICGKGITLSGEELEALGQVISELVNS